jgi:hypothetical protein
MAASSVSVVLNALLLNRWRPTDNGLSEGNAAPKINPREIP